MNKNIRIKNKEEWADFTLSYLHIAELALREIIDKKFNNENFGSDKIYIPTLYNIKHAIEIFLKFFTIEFLDKENLDNSDYSHDIEVIFTKLKRNIPNSVLESFKKRWNKDNSQHADKIGTITLEDLQSIVEKYHSLDFLKEIIQENYSIKDLNNTAFKYPTNDLNIQINYKEFSKRITIDMVRESLIDVINLEKMFWQLQIVLYFKKEHNI